MTPETAINKVARDLVMQARRDGRSDLTFAQAREMVRRARARGEQLRANGNR